MRRNQRHTQEEMYLAIDIWQESGLSMHKYCKLEKLAHSTFQYWLKKYRREKNQSEEPLPKSFIPVEVPLHFLKKTDSTTVHTGIIIITYPHGVQVSCPATISMQQLKTLINL